MIIKHFDQCRYPQIFLLAKKKKTFMFYVITPNAIG